MNNPEYSRRYYALHREQRRAESAAYRALHREEIRARRQSYHAAHRERLNAAAVAWHKEHPEGRRASSDAWKRRNPERVKTNIAAWRTAHPEWRREHPESGRAAVNRRRARIAGAGGSHTVREWIEKIELFAACCAYCGRDDRQLERDHRIPLSRGGSDSITNIVPACRSCNSKKGTRTDSEYLGRNAA